MPAAETRRIPGFLFRKPKTFRAPRRFGLFALRIRTDKYERGQLAHPRVVRGPSIFILSILGAARAALSSSSLRILSCLRNKKIGRPWKAGLLADNGAASTT